MNASTHTPAIDLTGKTALVTGSTRGMGRSIADLFAKLGASVMVTGRDERLASEVAHSISGLGSGSCGWRVGDLCDRDFLNQLVDDTVLELGEIDILIGNAGTQIAGVTSSISEDDVSTMLELNVLANHRLAQRVLPKMIERQGGSIVLVSSIGALMATSRYATYTLTKAAELGLVRAIAIEAGPHGVRANAVLPGVIKTEMSKRLWQNPELLATHIRRVPARRMGEPEDVAYVAAFLASEWASFVNGQALAVDGGTTISLDPILAD